MVHRKAAEQGIRPRSDTIWAACARDGLGVTQDYTEAVKWYLKAAEQGNGFLKPVWAECTGMEKAVSQDPIEAAKWYLKAC